MKIFLVFNYKILIGCTLTRRYRYLIGSRRHIIFLFIYIYYINRVILLLYFLYSAANKL